MGKAIPLSALKPHQAVGYWGHGDRSTLENQLTGVLSTLGQNQIVPYCRRSSDQQLESGQRTLDSDFFKDCVWGVAYLGLQQSDYANLPMGMIAALSASGQAASGQWLDERPSDGSDLSDAWAIVGDDQFTLGREPFGRVPLYWTQIGQVIWFASRLSLLLPIVETPQVSIPALYGYSCFSYVPTPLTPIAQIRSVPAGIEQTWTIDEANTLFAFTETRSLEWQEAPTQIEDEAIAVTHLQTLLKESVVRQINDLSDEPVGVLLSGGLDSSIVAALLVECGIKVRAYTLDFGTDGIPEYPYAEQVAEFLNIPLVKVDASTKRIRQALLPTARSLDLPFGDGVTVPLFLLMQAARQEVQVIFSGEGGDQLFAGWTNKPLVAAGVYQVEQPTDASFEQYYLRTFHHLWGYEAQIFQPNILTQLASMKPQVWLQEALNPAFSTTLLHRLRRATLMLKGAQNIHPRATNLGVAHGLKVRSPFCDLDLAQWAFQLSGALHLNAACEKYILKRAVEPWLPSEIVWRQKRGMGVPLTSWCLHGLWHELGHWLNPDRLRQEGIWQPHVAAQIATGTLGTLQGRRVGESLWLLMMWQVWQHVMLGTSSSYSFDHPFWLPPWIGQQYLRLQREITQW